MLNGANWRFRNLKKRGYILLIVLLCCLGIKVTWLSERPTTLDVWIDHIGQIEEEVVADDELAPMIEQLLDSQSTGRPLNQKENFVLGYHYYEEAAYREATDYLTKVLTGKSSRMRLYAQVYLLEISQLLSDLAYKLESACHLLMNLEDALINKEYQMVTRLMTNALKLENGKARLLEVIEFMLEHRPNLDDEIRCDLMNKAAILYFYNTNYARGIEYVLEVITLSKEMNNKYYGAKAMVDLGVFYSELGNIERANEAFYKALNIELSNPEDHAFIKTYAIVNLYESMLYEGNYDEIISMNQIMSKYFNDLSDELKGTIRFIYDVVLCNYYIKTEDYEEAERLYAEIETQYPLVSKSQFIHMDTNFEILKAGILRIRGEQEAAITIYEHILDQVNLQTKHHVLQELCKLLTLHGEDERLELYEQELIAYYEESVAIISADYSEYALYHFQAEQETQRVTQNKIKLIYISCIAAIISIALITIFYLKYIKLKHLNELDGLTQIYNRSYFDTYYRSLQNNTKTFAIIMLDIDYFKHVNDTYGHLIGDEVIKRVTKIMQEIVQYSGKCFRYGGEEFVIILEKTTNEELEMLAEKIRSTVAADICEGLPRVTISLGVATNFFPNQDVLRQADNNLYLAKRKGRNQVVFESYA